VPQQGFAGGLVILRQAQQLAQHFGLVPVWSAAMIDALTASPTSADPSVNASANTTPPPTRTNLRLPSSPHGSDSGAFHDRCPHDTGGSGHVIGPVSRSAALPGTPTRQYQSDNPSTRSRRSCGERFRPGTNSAGSPECLQFKGHELAIDSAMEAFSRNAGLGMTRGLYAYSAR
jgi:hypothetical protein